ncbi:hypothetical protein MAR_011276 [Mya arenaria]|uniref:Nuclease HARBI1 n=1 Tax=Mya arenaria TaxID=6604 RepID=A0ABY7FWZ7_MYAAR|nr:hypothetical protein MAR_011276 [Mya arenaria]
MKQTMYVGRFPNVIGLVDVTHIRINAPHQYEEDFVSPTEILAKNISCSFLHNFGLDHGDVFDRLGGIDVDQPDHDFPVQIKNPGNCLLFRDLLARTFFSRLIFGFLFLKGIVTVMTVFESLKNKYP